MKSPDGLIWNTPSRRKAFTRESRQITQAELDQIWEEIEAEEARLYATYDAPSRPHLVLVTPERARIEPSAGLGMP
jgi:hypothetical protein